MELDDITDLDEDILIMGVIIVGAIILFIILGSVISFSGANSLASIINLIIVFAIVGFVGYYVYNNHSKGKMKKAERKRRKRLHKQRNSSFYPHSNNPGFPGQSRQNIQQSIPQNKEVVYCNNCGNEQKRDSTFCIDCGNQITALK